VVRDRPCPDVPLARANDNDNGHPKAAASMNRMMELSLLCAPEVPARAGEERLPDDGMSGAATGSRCSHSSGVGHPPDAADHLQHFALEVVGLNLTALECGAKEPVRIAFDRASTPRSA
jgi:hypothetical protein